MNPCNSEGKRPSTTTMPTTSQPNVRISIGESELRERSQLAKKQLQKSILSKMKASSAPKASPLSSSVSASLLSPSGSAPTQSPLSTSLRLPSAGQSGSQFMSFIYNPVSGQGKSDNQSVISPSFAHSNAAILQIPVVQQQPQQSLAQPQRRLHVPTKNNEHIFALLKNHSYKPKPKPEVYRQVINAGSLHNSLPVIHQQQQQQQQQKQQCATKSDQPSQPQAGTYSFVPITVPENITSSDQIRVAQLPNINFRIAPSSSTPSTSITSGLAEHLRPSTSKVNVSVGNSNNMNMNTNKSNSNNGNSNRGKSILVRSLSSSKHSLDDSSNNENAPKQRKRIRKEQSLLFKESFDNSSQSSNSNSMPAVDLEPSPPSSSIIKSLLEKPSKGPTITVTPFDSGTDPENAPITFEYEPSRVEKETVRKEWERVAEVKRILVDLSKNDPTLKALRKDIQTEELLNDFKTKLTLKNCEKGPLNCLEKNKMPKLLGTGNGETSVCPKTSVEQRAMLYMLQKSRKLKADWHRRLGHKLGFSPSLGTKKTEQTSDKNVNKFEKTVRALSFVPKFASKQEENDKKTQILNAVKKRLLDRIVDKKAKKHQEVDKARKVIENELKTRIDHRKEAAGSCTPNKNPNVLIDKIFDHYFGLYRSKMVARLIEQCRNGRKDFTDQQIGLIVQQLQFETEIKQIFAAILQKIAQVKREHRNEVECLNMFQNMKIDFLEYHRNNPRSHRSSKSSLSSMDSVDKIHENWDKNLNLNRFLPAFSQHFHNVYLECKAFKAAKTPQKECLKKQKSLLDDCSMSVCDNDDNNDKTREEIRGMDDRIDKNSAVVPFCEKKQIFQERKQIRKFIKSADKSLFCPEVERLLFKKSLRRAGIPFNPFLFPGMDIDERMIERRSVFQEECFPLLPCVHSSLFLKMVNYQRLLDREHVVFLCSTDSDSIRSRLFFCYEKSCVEDYDESGASKDLFFCLTCGGFFCNDKHHSYGHFEQSQHSFALGIKTSYIFCFLCNKFIFDYDFDPTVKLLRESLIPIWKQNLLYHWEKGLWRFSTGEYYPELKLFRLDFSNTRMGFTGLFNLGSTCFMNSIISILVHAAGFREYLLTQSHRCPEKRFQSCIGCEFSQMAYQLYFGSRFPVIPARFYDLVWVNMPHLAFYGEQDAHEFFTSILDVLHEHYKLKGGDKCDCIVHKLFYGVLQSELTCQTCRTMRTTDEIMMGFNLDLKDQSIKPAKNLRTLEDCLNLFTKLEDLGPDMLLTCEKCDHRRQTSKRMKIKHLPAIIGFQFKRFEQVGLKSLKIPHKVAYKLDMDLGPFVDGIVDGHPDYQYTLYAVVNHIGSLHSGHYTSSIRSDDGHWYLFNDEYVERISQNAVLNNMNAYMVFYRRKNMYVRRNTAQKSIQN